MPALVFGIVLLLGALVFFKLQSEKSTTPARQFIYCIGGTLCASLGVPSLAKFAFPVLSDANFTVVMIVSGCIYACLFLFFRTKK